jgi:predicted dehydrogenase
VQLPLFIQATLGRKNMAVALKVAVIGAGQIAQRGHLPGYIQAGTEIVALCDSAHPELDVIKNKFND